MSTPTSTPYPPSAAALRMTMFGMVAAIPMFTSVVWFVVGAPADFPAAWTLSVPLAMAAAAYAYCELAGFRAPPLGPGGNPAEVENQSWLHFSRSTFVRLAICEAVFMVSVPMSFVATNFWPVLVGALLALPLIGWECWPGVRNRRRFAASLEAAGHPSYLLGRSQDLV